MPLPKEWKDVVPPPRPLAGQDEWNVFLSYRSVNRPWVVNLYDVLREAGHKVFLDQVVLAAGDNLRSRLQQALTRSQAGVLIWSKDVRDSDWVEREWQVMDEQARRKPGFCFVPLTLDDSDLPPFLKLLIYVNFTAYPDGPNGGELLRLLHGVVGRPLSDAAARLAEEENQGCREASAQIAAAVRNGRAERLMELFLTGGRCWRVSAVLGGKVAEGLTRLGAHEQALEVLQRLEKEFPKAIRPKQLRALALNRRARQTRDAASIDAAQDILGELYERGERDPETLGIYAATWMERYKLSGREIELRQSRDYYRQAFESAPDDYYTGINAAAKSVLLGSPQDIDLGAALAGRVQQIVGTEPHRNDYWKTATVGEAFLIQRNYHDAGRLYRAAVDMAATERGSHESTWAQARNLLDKLAPTPAEREVVANAFQHLA